jgi:NADPH-dependent ferric siderophore reductase
MTGKGVNRIRHEGARRRGLTVAAVRRLAPAYLAIDFACDDLADFVSLSEDDHVKLFFAGEPDADGKRPMRDYTPRRWDKASAHFTVEFALHDDPGPATAWAMAAQPGDRIDIGGPRGSMVVGDGHDWLWLIGDEAALPAIGRFLQERPDTAITALIAVAGPDEQIALAASPSHHIQWVHRPSSKGANPAALLAATAALPFPTGDGFIWIAAEAQVAKAIRAHVEERGHPSEWLKAKGYWTIDGAQGD